MAHRCTLRQQYCNGGPNTEKNYWRTMSGQHCILAEGDIGAPIYWRTNAPANYYWRTDGFTSPIGGQNKKNKKKGGPTSLVRLACFHANCLLVLTELYKQATKIC
jgi:hypothetical protein